MSIIFSISGFTTSQLMLGWINDFFICNAVAIVSETITSLVNECGFNHSLKDICDNSSYLDAKK